MLTYVDIVEMYVFVKRDKPYLCARRNPSLDTTIDFVIIFCELIFSSIKGGDNSFTESFKKAFVEGLLPNIDQEKPP